MSAVLAVVLMVLKIIGMILLALLLLLLLAPLLGADVLAEISSVGSLLILAISLNMLGVTKIRVLNLVPAMFFPLLLCKFL